MFNLPILLCAGFLCKEDYDRYSSNPEYFEKHITGLMKFYKENGFENVNDTIGQYEEQITMLYKPNKQKTTQKFQ